MDPLNYRQVKYHKHEWDNIPPVVPKFIINLSKYVEGLSNWANQESKIESVPQLRSFSERELNVSVSIVLPFLVAKQPSYHSWYWQIIASTLVARQHKQHKDFRRRISRLLQTVPKINPLQQNCYWRLKRREMYCWSIQEVRYCGTCILRRKLGSWKEKSTLSSTTNQYLWFLTAIRGSWEALKHQIAVGPPSALNQRDSSWKCAIS